MNYYKKIEILILHQMYNETAQVAAYVVDGDSVKEEETIVVFPWELVPVILSNETQPREPCTPTIKKLLKMKEKDLLNPELFTGLREAYAYLYN